MGENDLNEVQPAGLSPDDHGLLNCQLSSDGSGVIKPDPTLLAQKREAYKDDPIALEEIDHYDPDSSYRILIKKLYDMLNEGDWSEFENIKAEIFLKYPLTSSMRDQ